MVNKITVVGAGNVGATTAQRIADKELARASRCGHEPQFLELRYRLCSAAKIFVGLFVDRPLKTHRVFDMLVRLRRLDHP